MADGKQVITKKTTAKAATSGGHSDAPTDPPASGVAAAKGVTKKTSAKAASTTTGTKAGGAAIGGETAGAAASPAKATSTKAKAASAKSAPAKAAPTTSTSAKAATAKPTSAKPTPAKATPTKASPAKSTASRTATASPQAPSVEDRAVMLPPSGAVTPEERWRMVADAAYYRAEKRDFAPGYDHEDWLSAEAEVAALLRDRGQA